MRLGILVVCAGSGALGFLVDEETGSAFLGFGFIVGVAIGSFVYSPVMMARTGGQTVGHRLSDTRVVSARRVADGGGRAFLREALVKGMLIDGVGVFTFYVLPIVNYLFPLWDGRNEALHNKLCGTRVVSR